MHMQMNALGGQRQQTPPGAGVTGNFRVAGVSAGNQTHVLLIRAVPT